jgi:hypothetical protein
MDLIPAVAAGHAVQDETAVPADDEVGGAEVSKGLRGRNLPVEADMVRLEGVIKETGLYEVSLILGADLEAKPIEAKAKPIETTRPATRPPRPTPEATRPPTPSTT